MVKHIGIQALSQKLKVPHFVFDCSSIQRNILEKSASLVSCPGI